MPPKRNSNTKKQLSQSESAGRQRHLAIPEDFELPDEPTTINLDKEQKSTSKFITFDCPLCQGKQQLRNEIEINPKGIKCRCNRCSFKISQNDKTMNVSRDDNGDIPLDSEIHRITTPRNGEANRNQMISDVMTTPRSSKKQSMMMWTKKLSKE